MNFTRFKLRFVPDYAPCAEYKGYTVYLHGFKLKDHYKVKIMSANGEYYGITLKQYVLSALLSKGGI